MAEENGRRTFGSDFRQFFFRGLVILLPSVLTLWIVVKAYQFVDNTIAEPINASIRRAMVEGGRFYEPLAERFEPNEEDVEEEFAELRPRERADADAARAAIRTRLRYEAVDRWWDKYWGLNLIGLLVAIIVVYIAGRLLGGFVGRRMYRRIENFIVSLPVFKQVYPYVKQVVDFLFADEQPIKFNRVVAIEYPRKGLWSVGFMTGPAMRALDDTAGSKSVTVFIPSSPTPFTGYTLTVPASDIIEIPITVEEAIRFAVSGGVLVPDHQARPGQPGQLPGVPSASVQSPLDSAPDSDDTASP